MNKILVVDNDAGMRNLMAMAFRQRDIETFLTDDVDEAETFLEEGQCAAILMDFHLGAGASGARVLTDWGRTRSLPPFWLVTGTPEEADVRGLLELSSYQGTIAKPFSILDLVAAVKAAAFPEEASA